MHACRGGRRKERSSEEEKAVARCEGEGWRKRTAPPEYLMPPLLPLHFRSPCHLLLLPSSCLLGSLPGLCLPHLLQLLKHFKSTATLFLFMLSCPSSGSPRTPSHPPCGFRHCDMHDGQRIRRMRPSHVIPKAHSWYCQWIL